MDTVGLKPNPLPKHPTPRFPLCAALAIVGAGASVAPAALYTFDTEASMAGLSTPQLATRSDTGGISGGSLQPAWITGVHTLGPDAGVPMAGKSVTVSASFHLASTSLTRHGVGLFDTTGRNLGSFVHWGDGDAPILTYDTGHPFDAAWNLESATSAALGGMVAAPSGATWLNFSLTAAFIGASGQGSEWRYSASILDLGPTGTALPTTLYEVSDVTLSIPVPVPTSGIHGGFYTYGPIGPVRGPTDRIDNFFVIPEPSAALLALCAGAGVGLSRRRRHGTPWAAP